MKKLYNLILLLFIFCCISWQSYAQKLYFCEEYKDGEEIGVSDVFLIGSGGGYFTCMLDLRDINKKVNTESIKLKIFEFTPFGEKWIATEPFNVQPDWDYIYFDQFHTFYTPGEYKVTAVTSDGKILATGKVRIKFK
jgi:hypothetical protein